MSVTAAALLLTVSCGRQSQIKDGFTGSESCRQCHEKFYNLWDGSRHGLAMQPVTEEMVKSLRCTDTSWISISGSLFRPVITDGSLFVAERRSTADTLYHRALHALGGKYVYYFLTPLPEGKLQVLPLAYDVSRNVWYDNPGSSVRHFTAGSDSALSWMSHLFTFNTSCYSCHVSQLLTGFDITDLTYNTAWREPGINCETCHGPAGEHIRLFSRLDSGVTVSDMRIISVKHFTADQHNSSCGSCHARMIPVKESFLPGESFYDAFDLVTPENHDFYPDGRDLGENYTFTSWEMNTCKDRSDLNCVTCHTSSGRYRFTENPNDACLPCHEQRVDDPEPHTRHKPGGPAGSCVACHMPVTEFAMMKRSDHSFRPPSPAATLEFGSPNACNLCHTDRTPEWANTIVIRERGNYQDSLLILGRLVKEARENNWHNSEIIAEGIKNETFSPVFAAAFIRLADTYNAAEMRSAIIEAGHSRSPLVRASAARALTFPSSGATVGILLKLASDSVRLVRLNAGYALSRVPAAILPATDTALAFSAVRDYATSLIIRKDQWGSWYNLGNFYAGAGEYTRALQSYDMAVRLYPEATEALVNAGFTAYEALLPARAEEYFIRAIESDKGSEAAHLNLALLYGETGRLSEAEQMFYKTLAINPENPVAAYNLAVILSERDLPQALRLSEIAVKNGSDAVKYKALHDLLAKKASEK